MCQQTKNILQTQPDHFDRFFEPVAFLLTTEQYARLKRRIIEKQECLTHLNRYMQYELKLSFETRYHVLDLVDSYSLED